MHWTPSPPLHHVGVQPATAAQKTVTLLSLMCLIIIIIINVKINVVLSKNASRTRYTIKIKLKLRKCVPEKKSFQLSFERWE